MAISVQQQELIDLLRNELAELISFDFSPLRNGSVEGSVEVFEELEMHAENIGNAAELVGLEALAQCCKHSVNNFRVLAENPLKLNIERIQLVESWAVMLLGYLQYFGQGELERDAASALLDFLTSESWLVPMDQLCKSELMKSFAKADIQVEDDRSQYPLEISEEMVSLDVAADINPQLLKGLLTELPQQVSGFDRAIEQYLITSDNVQLRIAQRVAHTIKGAANVVGIPGMANLMHYVEDLLELSEKRGVPKQLGFVLQDAADCLSSIAEFLSGVGPKPDNVKAVLNQILDELRSLLSDDAVDSSGPVHQPDDDLTFDGDDEEDLFEMLISDQHEKLAIPAGIDHEASALDETQDAIGQLNENLSPTDFAEDVLAGADEKRDSPVNLDSVNSESEPDDIQATHLVAPIPTLEDVYHRPQTSVVNLQSVRSSSVNSEPKNTETKIEDSATQEAGNQSLPALEPKVATEQETVPAGPAEAADSGDDGNQLNLNINEAQAQELLRLTGENQIGNTQILSRLDVVSSGIQSAARYHQQLRQLAQDLERVVETQTALASALASAQGDQGEMDPLEMERYNELNTFASQLREVTTDAHESIAHLDEDLKSLKNLTLVQRQNGFETQDLLLHIRMLPVSVFTSRFQRCVRQAARLTSKKVRLLIEGEAVLVDSRVMTALVDPIMHLLRNAVDHGIENEEQVRIDNGKPAEGQVKLKFARMGDAVSVTCRDDGAGLDYEAIEISAKEKGLINKNARLSISDLNTIILSPGFSTRTVVSQTSGRGVGLDVVNDQLRQLKGSISIESEAGLGTGFSLIAPMSILSAHTLVVQCGRHRLSIVSRALEQIVYLEPDRLQLKGEDYYYQMMGEETLLAVMPLDRLVLLDEAAQAEKYAAIVVIRNSSGKRCGVLVEAIKASEEQIIKPLSKYTVKPQGVVGAAILGDGSVSPVIDLHDLPGIQFSHDQTQSWRKRFEQRLAHLQETHENRPMVLVVDDSLSARRSLAQFIGDMGLEVFTAKDGFEAIQIIEQKRPTIILADLEMPRMNGLELTSHLKADPATQEIPIIMITSRSTEKHRMLAAKAGVNSYLSKPWTDEELLTSIQSQMAS